MLKECRFALILALVSVFAFSCQNNSQESAKTGEASQTEAPIQKEVKGYIYTTTNGEGENQVVCLERYADGTLGGETVYGTGSNGGSDYDAPANGDYDNQYSLAIIEDNLLTVNTGGNTVSVFKVDKINGKLSDRKNVDANGIRPVSIAHTAIAAEANMYWVVVGNQWGTPTVLYDGEKKRRYPDDAFFKQDLSKPDASDKDRNIQLYRLNAKTGELAHVKMLDKYARKWGGPAQAMFSPDGKKLAVMLWGVPHFFTEKPEVNETRPSRFMVYDFANGEISNPRFYEEKGVIGGVGFDWLADNQTVMASYFNLIPEKDDHGLVVLRDNGKKVEKIGHHTTGAQHDVDEACWTTLSPSQDRLYVASFGTNVITPFSIKDSNVEKTMPFAHVNADNPHNDIKDMHVTPDNKYLYCVGAFSSFSMKIFEITDIGLTFKESYLLDVTKSAIGKPGLYDLCGIAGFEK